MTTATQNADSGTRRPQRPAPPPRRQLNLPAPMDGPLSRLADIGGDIRLAETLLATSNRYLAMIQHYMPTMTDREWGAIFDALRPPWTADPHLVAQIPKEVAYAIDTDRLDHKWGVDGRKLRTRLNRASYGERMAIAEMTMAFYRRLEDGETEYVIQALAALFQPQAPDRLIPAHTRISPALLLGEAAAEETAAAYRAAVGASAVTEAPPRPGTETKPDTDSGDDAGGGGVPQTETSPARPPEAPETPAAPPAGPEGSALEMALDTSPAHFPASADFAAEDAESDMSANVAQTASDAKNTNDAENARDAKHGRRGKHATRKTHAKTRPTRKTRETRKTRDDAENTRDAENTADAENTRDAENTADAENARDAENADDAGNAAPAPDDAAHETPDAADAPADSGQDATGADAAGSTNGTPGPETPARGRNSGRAFGRRAR